MATRRLRSWARRLPGLFHDGGEVAARAQELTRELGRKIEPGFEVFVANEQKGKSENREWNYVRKDGSRVPVLLSVAAIHDGEKGGLAGYLGIARDVSTINEATAALAESKSKLRWRIPGCWPSMSSR